MTFRIETAVHAYLRAGAGDQAPRTGPFLMHYDAHNDGRFFNYAIPDDGAAPTPDEVAALIAEFDARHRIPRLEYLPGRCPHLEPALLAAGFTAEARPPVLTCRPEDTAEPAPAPAELLLAATDEELQEVAGAQAEAYGQAAASGHDVARLRRVQDRGGLVALARDTGTGRGVGGGQ